MKTKCHISGFITDDVSQFFAPGVLTILHTSRTIWLTDILHVKGRNLIWETGKFSHQAPYRPPCLFINPARQLNRQSASRAQMGCLALHSGGRCAMNIPVRGHLLPSVGSIYLRFFLQKVDIKWRNLCSIYSSNHAEHISEIIFQFRVVVWPCHMNLFHIDFDKKTKRWRQIFSMLREAPSVWGNLHGCYSKLGSLYLKK